MTKTPNIDKTVIKKAYVRPEWINAELWKFSDWGQCCFEALGLEKPSGCECRIISEDVISNCEKCLELVLTALRASDRFHRVLDRHVGHDVVLVSNDGKEHGAHWLALACCGTDHFAKMKDSGMKEAMENRIEVEVTSEVVEVFLDWVYRRWLPPISWASDVCELLLLADMWQIDNIPHSIYRDIEEGLESASLMVVLDLLKESRRLPSPKLLWYCTEELTYRRHTGQLNNLTNKRIWGREYVGGVLAALHFTSPKPRVGERHGPLFVPRARPTLPKHSIKEDKMDLDTTESLSDELIAVVPDAVIDEVDVIHRIFPQIDIERFSDVTIESIDGRQFKSYKGILLAASKNLGNAMEHDGDVVKLAENGELVEKLVKWLHSGKLSDNLSLGEMQRLCYLGEEYGIPQLKPVLKHYAENMKLTADDFDHILGCSRKCACPVQHPPLLCSNSTVATCKTGRRRKAAPQESTATRSSKRIKNTKR